MPIVFCFKGLFLCSAIFFMLTGNSIPVNFAIKSIEL